MAHDSLERANEEIERARETAADDEVERQLRERADLFARVAQRMDSETDNHTPDRHQDALRPVSVDAGDAVTARVVEANNQLSEFRESVGY